MIRYTVQLPPIPDMPLTSRKVYVSLNGSITVFSIAPDAAMFTFEAHADENVTLWMVDEAGVEVFSPASPLLEFVSNEKKMPPQPGPMSIVAQETV